MSNFAIFLNSPESRNEKVIQYRFECVFDGIIKQLFRKFFMDCSYFVGISFH